jgi:methyl coenzyme M reductase beta subunit
MWLAVQGVVSVAIGMVRGSTVRLYERGGHLWARYSPLTLALWVASIAARFGLAAAAVGAGAGRAAMTSSTMLMFGLSLAAESLIVLPRAHASGIPVLARS